MIFVLVLSVITSSISFEKNSDLTYNRSKLFSFGGPNFETNSVSPILSISSVSAETNSLNESSIIFANGAIFGLSNPAGALLSDRDGVKKYKIQKGDTLSSIAAKFGITLETLKLANPELKSRILQKGQELTILPISGIIYSIKEGDSIESIANRYQINIDSIQRYNKDYQKMFDMPGAHIILPYAKSLGDEYSLNHAANNLPDLKSYFALPAIGWNWGELHVNNAVDIANSCGTPVYASAEGLVIEDEKFGEGELGWNAGYGLFILVEHPNGTMTRYAHLGKKSVKTGDYVSQGDKIALIGNTGNTHGPTGCHLHFEVVGAKNPFALR